MAQYVIIRAAIARSTVDWNSSQHQPPSPPSASPAPGSTHHTMSPRRWWSSRLTYSAGSRRRVVNSSRSTHLTGTNTPQQVFDYPRVGEQPLVDPGRAPRPTYRGSTRDAARFRRRLARRGLEFGSPPGGTLDHAGPGRPREVEPGVDVIRFDGSLGAAWKEMARRERRSRPYRRPLSTRFTRRRAGGRSPASGLFRRNQSDASHPLVERIPVVQVDPGDRAASLGQQLGAKVAHRAARAGLKVVTQGAFDQSRQRLPLFGGTYLGGAEQPVVEVERGFHTEISIIVARILSTLLPPRRRQRQSATSGPEPAAGCRHRCRRVGRGPPELALWMAGPRGRRRDGPVTASIGRSTIARQIEPWSPAHPRAAKMSPGQIGIGHPHIDARVLDTAELRSARLSAASSR